MKVYPDRDTREAATRDHSGADLPRKKESTNNTDHTTIIGGRSYPKGFRTPILRMIFGAIILFTGIGLIAWLLANGTLGEGWQWIGNLDAQEIQRNIRSIGPWAPLASFGLMILHTFLPFPLEILAAANGFVFGAAGGIALTWSSMMVSAWVGYAVARFANRLIFRVVPTERLRRMESWAAERSSLQLVAVRFIPVISFSLLNLALGLLRVSFWRYSWTTALGIIPIVVISVVSGNLLKLGPWGWIGVGAVVLIFVLWEIWRHGWHS